MDNNTKFLQKRTKRLMALLYNAIVWIDEACSDFLYSEDEDIPKWFRNIIGITPNELKMIGCDWLFEEKE